MMANFKKIDDFDFVFVNKPLSEEENKAFSNFLAERKLKTKTKPKRKLYCEWEGFRKTNFVLVPAERYIYRHIIVFVFRSSGAQYL